VQTPGMDLYNKRKYLSISSLVAFSRCPRRYFYSSGVKLRPRGLESPALKYGSALHAAIPLVLKNPDDVKGAFKAFCSIWTDDYEGLEDPKRNRMCAIKIIEAYARDRREGFFEILEPPDVGELKAAELDSPYEVPFAIDIGLDVPLMGKIDGLVRHKADNKLYAWELKTTSQYLSGHFFKSFTMNPQVIGYALAMRTMCHEPIEGVIVDGILVHKTRFESYAHTELVRERHFEDFTQWAQHKGAELLECEKRGTFPKHYTGCHPYSMFGTHGFTCDYTDLCQADDWRVFLEEFEISTHEPFGGTEDTP
jgi:hypothetical protein